MSHDYVEAISREWVGALATLIERITEKLVPLSIVVLLGGAVLLLIEYVTNNKK